MRVTLALLAAAVLAAVSVSQACPRVRVNPGKHFHASYSVAGAGACHRVRVDDTTLTYTYYVAPESLIEHWMLQMPCYRESDLKTVTAVLSRNELDELARVVNKSGFLRLPDRCYGELGEGMSPPYTISVGSDKVEKRVVFISYKNAPPGAFVEVQSKLTGMLKAKFGHTCSWLK